VTLTAEVGGADISGQRFLGAFVCAAGTVSLSNCEVDTSADHRIDTGGLIEADHYVPIAEQGGSGILSITLPSVAAVGANGDRLLNCTSGECEILVADIDVLSDRGGLDRVIEITRLGFTIASIPPALTITPGGNHVEGQAIGVSVDRYFPDASTGNTLDLFQCADGAGCIQLFDHRPLAVSSNGRGSTVVTVRRYINSADCTQVSCWMSTDPTSTSLRSNTDLRVTSNN